MKICIITGFKNSYAPNRILEEGKKMGHEMYLMEWENVKVSAGEKIFIGDDNFSIDYFDAVIPRSDSFSVTVDGEKYRRDAGNIVKILVEYCKVNKIYYLNGSYFSSFQSEDKIAQQIFFFMNNLPGIETFFSRKEEDINNIQLPAVIKTSQGSRGIGVHLMKNVKEIMEFVNSKERINKNYLFQKFHKIDYDFRVLVLGAKVLGIMKRIPKLGEWKTNISLGGIGLMEKDNKEIEKLGLEVAQKMKLEYAGIDILESDGKYYIIETNSLPQFGGFEAAIKEANVAQEIISYVVDKTIELKA